MPSHFTPLRANSLCPAPDFVSVSCCRNIITIITTTNTTTRNSQHSSSSHNRVADIGYKYWKNSLDAFDISWPAHRKEKGHRLFAPGAFPPRVNLAAQSELIHPHTTTTTTTTTPHRRLLSLVTSPHSPPRTPPPPLHSAPAQRNHNNGFDTAAHVAPRANTPYAHARSTARHLRAISHSPFKAKHRAKQPLRLSSL